MGIKRVGIKRGGLKVGGLKAGGLKAGGLTGVWNKMIGDKKEYGIMSELMRGTNIRAGNK